MSEPVYDHVGQQYPFALIGPIHDQIRVLEGRTAHYVRHVRLSPEDQQTMKHALDVLRNAREQLAQLQNQST